ncbi:hypothetical protein ACMAZF_12595 [Psychrobium sp. nBUS_13]|uniref:hypothetical protein n=1 Tax=Psychrobium sp. nBUS_13 TaxID=3395319 RepID=UPI003EBA0750
MHLKSTTRLAIYTLLTGFLYIITSGILNGSKHIASNVSFYVFMLFFGLLLGTWFGQTFRSFMAQSKWLTSAVITALCVVSFFELKMILVERFSFLTPMLEVPYAEIVVGVACIVSLLNTRISPIQRVDADRY